MEKKDENEKKGGKKGKKAAAKPPKVGVSCFDEYVLFWQASEGLSVTKLKDVSMFTGGRWSWRERTREASEERQEGTAQGQIELI